MTQPIILTSGQIRQWGERRTPLPRTKAYAFSLDLAFHDDDLTVDFAAQRAAAQGSGPRVADKSGLYHVQDEVLIKSADGAVRNIPQDAQIRHATVLVCASPTGGADLQARLLAQWESEAFLSMDVTGVLAPSGSLLRAWSEPRTGKFDETIQTTISLRTECENSSFRWLVQNQLFGWGQLRIRRDAKNKTTAEFTYDLYSMGG
jgi:hypothetical protein